MRRKAAAAWGLVALLIWVSAPIPRPCSAQDHEEDPELERASIEAKHSIPFPLSLLVPAGIRAGYDMRSYIRSDAFGAFDSGSTNGAPRAMPERVFDEIYDEAIELTHGNLTEALLAASFGSFEHEVIPLRIFGASIDLPLTTETRAEFLHRVSHLPEHLYHIPEGDRDKIQHFYASAWLKSALGMDWLVRLLGHAVETGESLFVADGFVDPRDLHANADGLQFVIRSDGNLNARPSSSLTPNP